MKIHEMTAELQYRIFPVCQRRRKLGACNDTVICMEKPDKYGDELYRINEVAMLKFLQSRGASVNLTPCLRTSNGNSKHVGSLTLFRIEAESFFFMG
jgi:hypothetical protein